MRLISTYAEEALQKMLVELQGKSKGYAAIHYHFSQLKSAHRNRFQLNVASNIIQDLIHRLDGGIFLCHDGDIIVICQLLDQELAEKITYQLRYLFFDDPLAYTKDQKINTHFCSYYLTEESWFDFIAVCRHKIALMGYQHDDGNFDAAWLAKVEQELPVTDTGRLLRGTAVRLVQHGTVMDTVFTRYAMSLHHLCQIFGREQGIDGSHPYYRYLSVLLDKYLLELLQEEWLLNIAIPLSIRLSIATLCSSLFEQFHYHIQGTSRSNIVLSLDIGDLFSDMVRFNQLLPWLQEQGYRLCLEGVDPYSVFHIDRESLGFDLLMMDWQHSIVQGGFFDRLKRELLRQDPARVILSQCNSKEAYDIGRALNLSLFRGSWLGEVEPKEEDEKHYKESI